MEVYVSNKFLTEEPFFRRELNLRFTYINLAKSKLPNQSAERINIAVESISPFREYLRKLPKDSVNLFLLGNETFEVEPLQELNDYKSIANVFTQFIPRFSSWYFPILVFMAWLNDGFATKPSDMLQMSRDFRSNYLRRSRTKNTRFRYPLYEIPLGYSRSFDVQLQKYITHLSHDESILLSTPELGFFPIAKKQLRVGFVGQRGNFYRQHVLRIASSIFPHEYVLYEQFGGNSNHPDGEYFRILKSCQMNLVPPGATNVRNHRYTESFILGSLPLVLPQSVIDSSLNKYWSNLLPWKVRISWKYFLQELARSSTDCLTELYLLGRNTEFNSIREAREQIREVST